MKKHAIILISALAAAVLALFLLVLRTPASIKPHVFKNQKYNAARGIQATRDGGYILAGMSTASGAGYVDAYLLKLDSSGKKQWDNYFGGKDDDRFYSVITASNGDFVMAGSTASYGAGGNDFLLVRTDNKGNMKFMKTFGFTGNETAMSLMETADNGFMITGPATDAKTGLESCLIVKADQDGNSVWAKVTNAGSYFLAPSSIITGVDGGYIISGSVRLKKADKYDFSLIKFDLGGNTLWSKSYGGPGSEMSASVIKASDGGYVICGSADSFGQGNNDVYLVKTDADGDCVWSRTYGDAHNDSGAAIINDGNAGYVIGSTSESYTQGSSDLYVFKTDLNGVPLWSRNFGTGADDYLGGIALSKDGGVAATGWVNNPAGDNAYEIIFVKMDQNGNY